MKRGSISLAIRAMQIESKMWYYHRCIRKVQMKNSDDTRCWWEHTEAGCLMHSWWELLFTYSVVCNYLRPHGLQHTRLPCPSPSPRVCSDSCPFSWWCHPTISILSHPLLLLPSIFPSIRVFSNESALCIRWQMYWSFSFSIIPSNEYSGLTSFRIDWFDLLEVQGTLKCLLQHHNLKATILWHSAFFVAQFSHPYMTTGKTVALTICTFVSKVMSLLFNTLSRFVIAFFPRSKCLLIWWLQSLSAVILEPQKIKSATASIFSHSICHEVMGPNVMTLVLWMSHSYTVKGSINNVKRQTKKSKRPLPLM